MARVPEEGLNYFPLNTDIIHNPKIKLVVAEFGPKTWALLLPLLCKIYREKGYWTDWYNEDGKLLFAKDECGLEVPFVNEVVNGLVRRGFFDKTVYDEFGVLTSDRIQENFLEAKKRGTAIKLIDEFILLEEKFYSIKDNVSIITLNVNILNKKVNINPQKKTKQNKTKDSLEGEQKNKYKILEKTKAIIVDFIRKENPKFITPYVDLWNLFADERKKAKVKTLTDMRLKKFNVRIHEEPFDFLAILAKSKNCEFLMTRSFFTFDWVIENQDNYVQILEGKYDNNQKPAGGPGTEMSIDPEKHKSEAQKLIENQRRALAEN